MNQKFNIDDEVWTYQFHNNMFIPQKVKILGINIYKGKFYNEITYRISQEMSSLTPSFLLFKTREEAQKLCNRMNQQE